MNLEWARYRTADEQLKYIMDKRPNALEEFLKKHWELKPIIAAMMSDILDDEEEK